MAEVKIDRRVPFMLSEKSHTIFLLSSLMLPLYQKPGKRAIGGGKIPSYFTLKIKESLKLVQGLKTTACMEGYQITYFLFSSAPNCGLIHFPPVMREVYMYMSVKLES